PDTGALDLVLRARALRGYGAQGTFAQAVTLLNQAIQRDPRYAAAWVELANAYAGAATSVSQDPAASAAQAKAAAARALELEPSSADAYAAIGYVDAMVLLEWKRGEDELRSALALGPQNWVARQRLASLLMTEGRFDEAMEQAKIAENLDPLAPNAGVAVGMIYFLERRYGEALAQWRRVASLHPDVLALHELIGMALEARGDYAAALAEYSSVAAQFPVDCELRS